MARREWNVAGSDPFGWLPKSAGTPTTRGNGGIRQEKTPTESGWGLVIGGVASLELTPNHLILNVEKSEAE